MYICVIWDRWGAQVLRKIGEWCPCTFYRDLYREDTNPGYLQEQAIPGCQYWVTQYSPPVEVEGLVTKAAFCTQQPHPHRWAWCCYCYTMDFGVRGLTTGVTNQSDGYLELDPDTQDWSILPGNQPRIQYLADQLGEGQSPPVEEVIDQILAYNKKQTFDSRPFVSISFCGKHLYYCCVC